MELTLVKAQPLRSVYVRADVNAFEAVIDPSIRQVFSDTKFHTSKNAQLVEQFILQSGEQKGFQTRDKEILWNMEINTFQARHEVAKEWSFFVSCMGFAHSQKVAADHLQLVNRWSGRKIVVMIADHGWRGHGAHEFFQLALSLHSQLGCNVLLFEPPDEFQRNVRDYVEIMPSIILKILDFYRINKIATIGLGYGGAVAFRMYMLAPMRFSAQTHILINPRFPEGVDLPERFDIVQTLKKRAYPPSQFWVIRLPKKLDQDGLPIKPVRITHDKRKMSDKILEDNFQQLLQRVVVELKGLKKKSPEEVKVRNGVFFDEFIFTQDIHHKNFHWFCMFPHDPQTLLILLSQKSLKCFITYLTAQRFPFQHEIIPMPGAVEEEERRKKEAAAKALEDEQEEEQEMTGGKKKKKKKRQAAGALRELGVTAGGGTAGSRPSSPSPATSVVSPSGTIGHQLSDNPLGKAAMTTSSSSGFDINKDPPAGPPSTSEAVLTQSVPMMVNPGGQPEAAPGPASGPQGSGSRPGTEGKVETLLPTVAEEELAPPGPAAATAGDPAPVMQLADGTTIDIAELQAQASPGEEVPTLEELAVIFRGPSDDIAERQVAPVTAAEDRNRGDSSPQAGDIKSAETTSGNNELNNKLELNAEQAKQELRLKAADEAKRQESHVHFGLIREMDAIVNRPEELGYDCFGELPALNRMRTSDMPDPTRRPVLIGKEINPLRKLRLEEHQNEIMRKMAVGGLETEAEEKKERQRAVKWSIDQSEKNLRVLERENEDFYNRLLLEKAQREEAQMEAVRKHERKAMLGASFMVADEDPAGNKSAGTSKVQSKMMLERSRMGKSSTAGRNTRFGASATQHADAGKKMAALKELLAQPAVAPAEVLVGDRGAVGGDLLPAGVPSVARAKVELRPQVPVSVDSFEDENSLAEVYRSRLADAQREKSKEELEIAKKKRHEKQHTTREMRLVQLMQQRKEMDDVKKLYDEQQKAVKIGDPETRKMEAVLQMSRDEFEQEQRSLERSVRAGR
mmetsp:Transcript_17104/g.42445  ORF Transcript_17104/g.42445 Transcript_17104/m.42445 type:complete len:1022 (-) Transcript_17104:304-3369(-)